MQVTTASRTLIDLGAAAPTAEVERAFEAAIRLGLTTPWHVVSRLDELAACGRNGVGVMRTVLRRRDPRLAPTESELETRLWELLADSHLPVPERQYYVADRDGVIGRHDFVYPEQRLVIEAQSARWHLSQEAWRRDMDRRNRLTLAGWRVLEVGWQDIVRRPRKVLTTIESALFNVVVENRLNR
jgi:very-short-patch-repair endonuclease